MTVIKESTVLYINYGYLSFDLNLYSTFCILKAKIDIIKPELDRNMITLGNSLLNTTFDLTTALDHLDMI